MIHIRPAAFLLLGVPLAVILAVAASVAAQGTADELYTLDLTGPDGLPDGLVDAVELEFDLPVGGDSIRPGDFLIEFDEQEILPHSFSHRCTEAIATSDSPDDTCFRLHFRQVTAFTGREADLAKLEVTYKKQVTTTSAPMGTLETPWGAVIGDATWNDDLTNVKDGAGPVLLGAFARSDSTTVYAVFSEDVGAGVVGSDFRLCDANGEISGVEVFSAVHPSTRSGSDNREVEITLDALLGSGNFANGYLVASDTCPTDPAAPTGGGPSDIEDAAFATVVTTQAMPFAWQDGAEIRRVIGERGSDRMLVEFWAPVGTGTTLTQAALASDFTVVPAQGGSGASIVDAIHTPGHRVVELVLSRGLAAADMKEDGTGYKVRPVADEIWGYAGAAGPVSSDQQEVEDTLAPQLIDAIRLEFSEVVIVPDPALYGVGWEVRPRDRDSVTCSTPSMPPPCLAYPLGPGPWVIVGEGTDAQNHRLPEELPIAAVVAAGNGDGACEESYTAIPRMLYICFEEGLLLKDEPGLRCRIDGQPAEQVCLGTGQEPAVSYAPGHLRDASGAQNPLSSISGFLARDRVLPRIIDACTFDGRVDGLIVDSQWEVDGYIDGYSILFSEAMQGSLQKRDWDVQGRVVEDVDWLFTTSYRAFINIEPGESPDDARDTGMKPNVQYDKDPQSPFFYDARKPDLDEPGGNFLRDHGFTSIVERDCAPPFMYEVFGIEESEDVTVRFSEPVAGLKDEELVELPSTTPFYRNYNNRGAGAIQPGSFEHTLGEDSFTFRVTQPLHKADVVGADTDAVLIAADRVYQNTLLPELAMPRSEQRIDGEELPDPDTAKPPRPGSITVAHGSDPATSAKLSFAAVVDPPVGQSNAGVAKYEVRYHTQQLGTNAFGDQVGTMVPFTSGIETSGTQDLLVTGLTPETDYWFAVRAVDKSGNAGDPQATTGKHTTLASGTGPVGTAPAAVGTITTTANANSVTLAFTCPADDDDAVVAFAVRASDEEFTAAEYTSKVNELGGAAVRTTGATSASPCAAGDPVTIQVIGLESATEYWFSVVAQDADRLKSAPSAVVSETTTTDTTKPPKPVPVVAEPTGAVIRTTDRVVITWPDVLDPDSTVRQYVWTVDDDPTTTLTLQGQGTETTTEPRAVPTTLGVGDNWFHVAAVSAGGIGDAAHLKVTVQGASSVTETEVTTVNRDIQRTVKAVRSGDNVRITWQVPDDVTSLDGVQIWCMQESGGGTLIRQLDQDSAQYSGGVYTDVDATCDGGYAVTGYHTGGTGLASTGDSGDIPGFTSLLAAGVDEEGDSGVPMLLIIILAAAGVLILAGVVLFVVLRGRKGGGGAATTVQEADEAEWGAAPPGAGAQQLGTPEAQEPTWGEAGGADEPAWADEEGGGDEPAWADTPGGAAAAATAAPAAASGPAAEDTGIHQVTCPECNEVFVAEGSRPLRIECPNCGVQGMLS